MRKLFTLNADEAMTLVFLSKLNRELLTIGLTAENRDDLKIYLLEIVRKITYKK